MSNIYTDALLYTKINLESHELDSNLESRLQTKLNDLFGGICIEEGYVRKGKISLKTYAEAMIHANKISFNVSYTCQLCVLSKGMEIDCVVHTRTPMSGVYAHVMDNGNQVLRIILPNDYHSRDSRFADLKVSDKITIIVTAYKYELGQTFVTVIGKLKSADSVEDRVGGYADIENSESDESSSDEE